MVPKIIHLYWGMNRPMSYLRYLTVLTFQKLNPDWEVKLWTPTVPSIETNWNSGEQVACYRGVDYAQELNFTKFDFSSIGIPESTPEVHKSDLLRWYLLGHYGGIWSDFDIIWVKPIPHAPIWEGAGLCRYKAVNGSDKDYTAIGFLTSSGRGQYFFDLMFKVAARLQGRSDYQAYGAQMLDYFLEIWPEGQRLAFWHDPELVYHYCQSQDFKLYFRSPELKRQDTLKCLGYHWYAGNPYVAKCEATVQRENFKQMCNSYVICREARRVIS